MPCTMIRRFLPAAALALAVLPIAPAGAACHVASFSGQPYVANESAGKVTITVTNGQGAGLGSVDYKTKNGTAKAPKDYTAAEGTLVFPPGTQTVSFNVAIVNDGTQEQDETFFVELSNPTGCFTTLPDEPAKVTIEDNDQQIVQPTPTPTPTQTKKPTPKPSTASPSPTSSSPSPTSSSSPIAIGDTDDGGLSGGALAGIIGGTVVVGGAAAFWVRRKFLV